MIYNILPSYFHKDNFFTKEKIDNRLNIVYNNIVLNFAIAIRETGAIPVRTRRCDVEIMSLCHFYSFKGKATYIDEAKSEYLR